MISAWLGCVGVKLKTRCIKNSDCAPILSLELSIGEKEQGGGVFKVHRCVYFEVKCEASHNIKVLYSMWSFINLIYSLMHFCNMFDCVVAVIQCLEIQTLIFWAKDVVLKPTTFGWIYSHYSHGLGGELAPKMGGNKYIC